MNGKSSILVILSHDGDDDSDGDWLTTLMSTNWEQTPPMCDTDGDYISDHYEVYTADTDPTDSSSTPDLPIKLGNDYECS